MLRSLLQTKRLSILKRYYSLEPLELGQIATELAIPIDRLTAALNANPSLSAVNLRNLTKCYSYLNNEGFKTNQFLTMIKDYPHIINRPESYITLSLSNWRNCQFGEAFTISLLTRYPQLIDTPKNELERRIGDLLAIFVNKKHVYRLLELNPSIMFQNWKEIRDKIDYVTRVMKVERSQIVKSTCLSQSIFHIRSRHTFLERLGLYRIQKHGETKVTLDGFDKFLLADIMDRDDDFFVKKVAGVSLIEFRTFQLIFKRELELDDNDSDGD